VVHNEASQTGFDMTANQLIDEGRRIQRRTVLLTPDGAAECAAIWYGKDQRKESDLGCRCWLSVNGNFIPSRNAPGWLSILTDDECKGGRIEVTTSAPKLDGVRLYPREIVVLPPIDAVVARGSSAVGQWLAENNWKREWRYNSNFRDRAIAEAYEVVERRENPLYWKGAYAVLGGWHVGWPDDDLNDLMDEKLLVQTFMDSEPWVEAWELRSGSFKVIQRIT
jgi:hypothetical protein